MRIMAKSGVVDNVDVYYNLHKHLWSCRCRRSGRVVLHTRVICATFGAGLIVREAGRLRVLAEGVKNVHAFVRIDSAAYSDNVEHWQAVAADLHNKVGITYNPYRAGTFVRRDTGEAVDHVPSLMMIAPEGGKPEVSALL
jgi:hypothetical protein